MHPFGFNDIDGMNFRGGITWQLDGHLRALEDATKLDDARLYANLVAQVAAILAPKLSPEEYTRLSTFDVKLDDSKSPKRQARHEYERKLFALARNNLAELLRLASKRGLYAMEDKSDDAPIDITEISLKD